MRFYTHFGVHDLAPYAIALCGMVGFHEGRLVFADPDRRFYVSEDTPVEALHWQEILLLRLLHDRPYFMQELARAELGQFVAKALRESSGATTAQYASFSRQQERFSSHGGVDRNMAKIFHSDGYYFDYLDPLKRSSYIAAEQIQGIGYLLRETMAVAVAGEVWSPISVHHCRNMPHLHALVQAVLISNPLSQQLHTILGEPPASLTGPTNEHVYQLRARTANYVPLVQMGQKMHNEPSTAEIAKAVQFVDVCSAFIKQVDVPDLLPGRGYARMHMARTTWDRLRFLDDNAPTASKLIRYSEMDVASAERHAIEGQIFDALCVPEGWNFSGTTTGRMSSKPQPTYMEVSFLTVHTPEAYDRWNRLHAMIHSAHKAEALTLEKLVFLAREVQLHARLGISGLVIDDPKTGPGVESRRLSVRITTSTPKWELLRDELLRIPARTR